MSGKSRLLYELMLRKGYPEEFSRLICAEMVAIKDLRDRLISKHIVNVVRTDIVIE